MQRQNHSEQHRNSYDLREWTRWALTCPHSDVTAVYAPHRILGHTAVGSCVYVVSVATGAERREEQRPIGQKFSGLRDRTHRFAVPGQPADGRRWAATRRAVHTGSRLVREIHARWWLLQEGWAQERCGGCVRETVST